MNRTCYLLLAGLLLLSGLLTAQTTPPTAPDRLDFAGISVRLDPDARQLVQQDINALLTNQRYWQAKLDRALLYFPLMDAILISEEVPVDFKYLAVQESSLSPDAVSASSAVGYWQFKVQTALNQGLRVDELIDERKNISASTHGAARYLKRSNAQFNNWVSSLYSYYLGATGISKLVPPDWSYARQITLNQTTDRYILRFFAHKIALENALASYRPVAPATLLEYADGSSKTLAQVAAELDTDEADLRAHNRWLLTDAPIPGEKPYAVAVPVAAGRMAELRARMTRAGSGVTATSRAPDPTPVDVGFPVLRKVTLGVSSKNDPILYEINGLPGIQAQTGDDVLGLARKSRVSMASFLRFNDMDELDRLVPMEVYYLAKKRKKALVPFHTVQDNETAWGIGQRYGIRLKKLMRYNRLDRVQKLTVGRVMWLRDRRPADKPVEIINAPAAPVNESMPSTRPVVRIGSVPRNPAERVLYQPKLAGTPTTEPARPTTNYPAPTEVRRPDTAPMSEPTPTYDRPVGRPVPLPADGSDRVVIVRPDDSSNRPATTNPMMPTTSQPAPGRAVEPAYSEPVVMSRPSASASAGRPMPVPPSVVKAPSPAPPRAAAIGGRAMKHTVQPGQTYYSVSKLYGVTVESLMEANNLTENDKLSIGQTLLVRNVPAGFPLGQEVLPTPAPTRTTPAGLTVYHVVEKGETMFRISKLYNVSIGQIQEWNQLSDATVKLGQRLRIVKQ
jgi:membrane-bound lytic murein transglycosylase D